jgi:ADP-ribose pyrophosphatase
MNTSERSHGGLTDYLLRLPPEARYPGDPGAGEIALVTEAGARARIEAERRARWSAAPAADGEHGELGVVFEDEYVMVVRDPVAFPSGTTGTYVRIFERSGLDGPSGVLAVPVRGGRVLLRRAFRHATRAWELECPRGFRANGEDPVAAMGRELAEELGIAVVDVRRLGEAWPNTGLLASRVHTYFVRLDEGPARAAPEAQEAFGSVVEIAFAELAGYIARGEIRDALTLSGLFQAQAHGLLAL